MKKFLFVSCLLISLMFAGSNSAMAQQTLPAGGNSFETAVKIQPGIYQGGPLAEGESIFYSLSGNAGQLVKVKWDDSVSINLYNEDKEILGCETGYNASAGKDENVWLPNSSKSTYTYYLKISNEGFRTAESFALEFSLADCYDANSQTDAGDVFEKALTIVPGNYQSCLSVGYIHDYGDDFIDYYKISVRKGETYEFKATPPTKGSIDLKMFSLNREEMDYKYSSNDGAIVTMSLTPADNTDIFLAVSGSSSDTSVMFFNYSLSVKTSAPLYKFYNCSDNYCEFAGEFVSKEECQKATAKTCYQTENCNGKCGITPPPSECTKDSDCPTGLVCLDSQCVSESIPPSLIECDSDSECEKGFMCQEGECIYKGNGEEWGGFFPISFGTLFSGWFGTLFSGWYFWLYLILLIVFYVYFAICLQVLAKKTDTPNGWLAWIPVANIFLMIQIAQKPLWWFILLLIPIVNIVIGVILWMKIAERRGKPNWLGILIIVPVVGIIIPGYLAFSGKEKIEITPPYVATGTQEANKPVVGYKHPCKYCGKLIPPNSAVCPFCEKANPLGPYRCPKCHEPVEKEWQVCPKCNQNLRIVCPHCGKITFFGDHCEDCGERLLIKCPHCGQEQPPLSDNCIKCGKPLKVEKR
jgi:hypothetical protein